MVKTSLQPAPLLPQLRTAELCSSNVLLLQQRWFCLVSTAVCVCHAESIVMVEACVEQSNDSTELESYNQFMKWLEEARSNFSSWYDRQANSKLVITTVAHDSRLFDRTSE